MANREFRQDGKSEAGNDEFLHPVFTIAADGGHKVEIMCATQSDELFAKLAGQTIDIGFSRNVGETH